MLTKYQTSSWSAFLGPPEKTSNPNILLLWDHSELQLRPLKPEENLNLIMIQSRCPFNPWKAPITMQMEHVNAFYDCHRSNVCQQGTVSPPPSWLLLLCTHDCPEFSHWLRLQRLCGMDAPMPRGTANRKHFFHHCPRKPSICFMQVYAKNFMSAGLKTYKTQCPFCHNHILIG